KRQGAVLGLAATAHADNDTRTIEEQRSFPQTVCRETGTQSQIVEQLFDRTSASGSNKSVHRVAACAMIQRLQGAQGEKRVDDVRHVTAQRQPQRQAVMPYVCNHSQIAVGL